MTLTVLSVLKSDTLKPATPPVSRYRSPLQSIQLTVMRSFKPNNATPTRPVQKWISTCRRSRARGIMSDTKKEGNYTKKCEGKLYLGHVNYFGSTDICQASKINNSPPPFTILSFLCILNSDNTVTYLTLL